MNEDEKLARLFQQQFDEIMNRFPVYATYLGYKHDKYDYLLPDGSSKAIEDDIIRIIKQKQLIQHEINYDALSPNSKLDYDLIIYNLDLTLFQLNEIADWKTGAAGGAVGFIGQSIYFPFVREYASLETRVDAIISRLSKAPKYLEETKTTFIFPIKLWTDIAIEEGPRTIGFLQLIQNTLKPKLDAELYKKLSETIEVAIKSIKEYTEWLKIEILPKSKHDWMIGSQKFSRLVELRKLAKTPQEILEIGEKALEDTKDELKKLGNELYPGKTIKEILDTIKNDHPPTFEMVLEHISELIIEARNFIRNNNLMDLPDEERLKVLPTPSFLIPLYPFAAYMPAEKFAKNQVGEYIVTPTEGNNQMLREHSYSNCRNIAVHEAYPGHHLQFTCSNIQPNLIRSIISGTETIEGWAHYAEQIMAEKGFLGKKEIFMQKFGQIWRAVRIIVDIKLHTGEMTFTQAKEMMMKEIGMNEQAVIAELKRYTLTPGYQLSYLLGKFMLLELRDELKKKMGQNYSDKFFHDTILHNGGLPIYFLRRLFDLKLADKMSKD